MKRICREDFGFDLIRMLDAYSRAQGVSISDEAKHSDFLSELSRIFEESKKKEILIHGLRAQAMFAHVAAAMGYCTAIKTEDAGDFYLVRPEILSAYEEKTAHLQRDYPIVKEIELLVEKAVQEVFSAP